MAGMSSTLNLKIQRVQNACIRFIYGVRRDEHITPYYLNGGCLKLEERRKLMLALLVLNVVKNQNPSYIVSDLIFLSTVHSINSRQSKHCLQVPLHRTVMYKFSFTVYASQVWNDLKLYNLYDKPLRYAKSILYESLLKSYVT